MYDVHLIAEYVIHRCAQNGRPLSNLKLQKILYFIQAEFLVAMNKPCFEDDIEAWSSGPVVPAVYSEYRIYGGTNIPDQGNAFEIIPQRDKDRLDAIMDNVAQYSSLQLTKIVHNQSPWKNSHRREDKIIKRSELRAYFAS